MYPNVELSWSSGFGAQLHIVYFGDNFDDVNIDAGGILQETTTYTPGPLVLDKVYCWRVNEFDSVVIHKGDIWSFRTLPEIDPNLIGGWKYDEGSGTIAYDSRGNGNDGTLSGGVEWVQGYLGTAVHLDTAGERIVIGPLDPTAEKNAVTLAAWINWEGQRHSIEYQGIFGKRLGWNPPDHPTTKWFWEAQQDGDLVFRNGGEAVSWNNGLIAPHANEWTHVALTWDNGSTVTYINGEVVETGNITFRDTADDTP